jgi:hypothetical protein
MNLEEFQTQMSRLHATFGEKAYSNERTKLIYNALVKLSAKQFASIITHFLISFKTAPLPKDIIEAGMREYYRNVGIDDKFVRPENECHWCGDSGVNTLKKKIGGQKAFIRCHCEIGQKIFRGIRWEKFPMWNYSLSNIFERLSFDESEHKEWVPKKNKTPVLNQIQEKKGEVWELVMKWERTRKFSEGYWRDFYQDLEKSLSEGQNP